MAHLHRISWGKCVYFCLTPLRQKNKAIHEASTTDHARSGGTHLLIDTVFGYLDPSSLISDDGIRWINRFSGTAVSGLDGLVALRCTRYDLSSSCRVNLRLSLITLLVSVTSGRSCLQMRSSLSRIACSSSFVLNAIRAIDKLLQLHKLFSAEPSLVLPDM